MRYVSFSGGADSTALAILLHERGEDFELVFADTAAELPETYWTIPRVAQHLGHRLHVLSGPTFFERLANRDFFLPGPQVRWCTRELKEKPMIAWFTSREEPPVVSIGIRAEEAHRWEKPPANVGNKYVYDRPLVEAGMEKADVVALCKRYDLLNPCYEWRSSCSCFCCPFQRLSDWRNLAERHPDLFALAEEWERLSFESPVNAPYGWIGHRKRLADIRETKESQLTMLREPVEEACSICRW